MQYIPKWLTLAVGSLLVILLALLIIDRGVGLKDAFNHANPKNTLTVSAEGKVSATPDTATIMAGIYTTASSAADAQNQSTQKINKITDYVKSQGVAKEDITTSNFNLYPQQNYTSGQSTTTGYQSNQTITIKVRKVNNSTSQLSKILAGVTDNGANQINGVTFSFDDPDNLKSQARNQAVAKAKQKAQELADAAGIKLGKVVNVSESSSYYPVPMYAQSDVAMGAAPKEATTAPTVEAGSQDVTVVMNVIFEVK